EGQVIVIQPGEKVAIDGILVSGESSVDTAALTGESLPQSVQVGDQVLSGMINMTGVIRVKVLHRVEDSTLSKILDLLENSTANKLRINTHNTPPIPMDTSNRTGALNNTAKDAAAVKAPIICSMDNT
ncbi:MAG: hypothetical protein KH306_04160, partial [Veillonella sp.]|nr:hypothetical protein [Veillonella sp.]